MDAAAILVISDSHGNLPALTAALRWAARQDGAAQRPWRGPLTGGVFLGDGAADLERAAAEAGLSLPWYAVRGNGDYDLSLPAVRTVEIAGRGLFLTHGNHYGVEDGLEALAAAAKATGAEAALFGHTHIPRRVPAEGETPFLLNPGSIGRPRSAAGHTFAILELRPGAPPGAEFYRLVKRGLTWVDARPFADR
ncbi:MAG: metallophosphoesterase family protein [Treponema sp.]|jgi:putative phosphoesterase|nr:metallophosphoesterase family protein [Treponema sp.]